MGVILISQHKQSPFLVFPHPTSVAPIYLTPPQKQNNNLLLNALLTFFLVHSSTMGFPVGYTELVLPKLFLHLLSVLGFMRKLITLLLCYMGFPDFLEGGADIAWPERVPEFHSVSAVLIGEILPVVKFSEMGAVVDTAESCAVCLYEFDGEDEIRRLTNCRHIFHRGCLDRWMGYDQRTCPLCRTPFIPHHMQAAFNDRLWAASGIPDFYYNHDD